MGRRIDDNGVYVRLRTSTGGNTVPSEGKFGVGADRAADLLRAAGRAGLRPHGLAFHVGSQMLSPAAWDGALRQVGAVLRELAADRIRLDLLDVGGGFPARYADVEPPPLAAFAAAIRAGIARTCRTGRRRWRSSRAGRWWPGPESWSRP
jgi:ornithine decarboxylase